MTEPVYDIVIREGRVATASDVFDADVAITGERIAAIGRGLASGKREINARGKLVLPGGVDSHAHIEQLSAAGIMNADTLKAPRPRLPSAAPPRLFRLRPSMSA
jgi:dihydropyrimidinase